MKKKQLFIITLCFCQIQAGAQTNTAVAPDFISYDYVSIETPISYKGIFPYVSPGKRINYVNIDTVQHDKALLSSLPNWIQVTTVYDAESNLQLNSPIIKAGSKTRHFRVVYDFLKVVSIRLKNEKTETSYNLLVGVGVRLVASLNVKSKNADLSSLTNIGLLGEKKSLTGKLEIRAFGVDLDKIAAAFVTTSNISPASIETVLQQVATIKSQIYDPNVIITPQILAYGVTEKNIQPSMIIQAINKQSGY